MRNRRPPVKMPVLFVGHGSPMNAIESNAFTRALEKLGQDLPRPRAICFVSAYWVNRGSQVLTGEGIEFGSVSMRTVLFQRLASPHS